MGRRSRRAGAGRLPVAVSTYEDEHGNRLELRVKLGAGSRIQQRALPRTGREEDWHRAFEFLFERLVRRWHVAGVDYEDQDELLGRLRMASADEREWVRKTIRRHCSMHMPDIQAP